VKISQLVSKKLTPT